MPLILFVLIINSVVSAYYNIENNDASDNLKKLYPYLDNSKKMTYTDSRSKLVLEYLSGYKSKINVSEFPENFKNVSDAYIVINRAMIKGLIQVNKNKKLPAEINNPPKKWKIIKDLKKKNDENAIIYYVP